MNNDLLNGVRRRNGADRSSSDIVNPDAVRSAGIDELADRALGNDIVRQAISGTGLGALSPILAAELVLDQAGIHRGALNLDSNREMQRMMDGSQSEDEATPLERVAGILPNSIDRQVKTVADFEPVRQVQDAAMQFGAGLGPAGEELAPLVSMFDAMGDAELDRVLLEAGRSIVDVLGPQGMQEVLQTLGAIPGADFAAERAAAAAAGAQGILDAAAAVPELDLGALTPDLDQSGAAIDPATPGAGGPGAGGPGAGGPAAGEAAAKVDGEGGAETEGPVEGEAGVGEAATVEAADSGGAGAGGEGQGQGEGANAAAGAEAAAQGSGAGGAGGAGGPGGPGGPGGAMGAAGAGLMAAGAGTGTGAGGQEGGGGGPIGAPAPTTARTGGPAPAPPSTPVTAPNPTTQINEGGSPQMPDAPAIAPVPYVDPIPDTAGAMPPSVDGGEDQGPTSHDISLQMDVEIPPELQGGAAAAPDHDCNAGGGAAGGGAGIGEGVVPQNETPQPQGGAPGALGGASGDGMTETGVDAAAGAAGVAINPAAGTTAGQGAAAGGETVAPEVQQGLNPAANTAMTPGAEYTAPTPTPPTNTAEMGPVEGSGGGGGGTLPAGSVPAASYSGGSENLPTPNAPDVDSSFASGGSSAAQSQMTADAQGMQNVQPTADAQVASEVDPKQAEGDQGILAAIQSFFESLGLFGSQAEAVGTEAQTQEQQAAQSTQQLVAAAQQQQAAQAAQQAGQPVPAELTERAGYMDAVSEAEARATAVWAGGPAMTVPTGAVTAMSQAGPNVQGIVQQQVPPNLAGTVGAVTLPEHGLQPTPFDQVVDPSQQQFDASTIPGPTPFPGTSGGGGDAMGQIQGSVDAQVAAEVTGHQQQLIAEQTARATEGYADAVGQTADCYQGSLDHAEQAIAEYEAVDIAGEVAPFDAQATAAFDGALTSADAAIATMDASFATEQGGYEATVEGARGTFEGTVTTAQGAHNTEIAAAGGTYEGAIATADATLRQGHNEAMGTYSNTAQAAVTGAQQTYDAEAAAAQTAVSGHQGQFDGQYATYQADADGVGSQAQQLFGSQFAAETSQLTAQTQATVAQTQAQIDSEMASGQGEIDRLLQQGQADAEAELAAGEQQARAERDAAQGEADAARREAEAKEDDRNVFQKVGDAIGSFISAALDWIKARFEEAKNAIVGFLEAARDAAVGLLNAARDAALAVLDTVRGLIQSLIDVVADVLRAFISAVAAFLQALIQFIVDWIVAQIQAITALINGLIEAFQAVVNAVVQGLVAAVALIDADLAAKLDSAASAFLDRFNAVCDAAQAEISAASEALTSQVQAAGDTLSNAVAQAEQSLISAVDSAEAALHAGVDAAYNVAVDAVNTYFDNAIAATNAAFDAARAAVVFIIDTAYAAIEFVATEISEHIQEVLTAVGMVAEWVTENIVGPLLEFLADPWKGLRSMWVSFWNSPWRDVLLGVALATLATVVCVATGGLGLVAMIAITAAVTGAAAAVTYGAGEMAARRANVSLIQEGEQTWTGQSLVDPHTGEMIPDPRDPANAWYLDTLGSISRNPDGSMSYMDENGELVTMTAEQMQNDPSAVLAMLEQGIERGEDGSLAGESMNDSMRGAAAIAADKGIEWTINGAVTAGTMGLGTHLTAAREAGRMGMVGMRVAQTTGGAAIAATGDMVSAPLSDAVGEMISDGRSFGESFDQAWQHDSVGDVVQAWGTSFATNAVGDALGGSSGYWFNPTQMQPGVRGAVRTLAADAGTGVLTSASGVVIQNASDVLFDGNSETGWDTFLERTLSRDALDQVVQGTVENMLSARGDAWAENRGSQIRNDIEQRFGPRGAESFDAAVRDQTGTEVGVVDATNNDAPEAGAASAVPESDFNPGTVEGVWRDPGADAATHQANTRQLDTTLNTLVDSGGVPAGVTRSGDGLMIGGDNGQSTRADVQSASREVHADMIANGEVARYERQADGSYQITVVPGLDPLMAQRAVAHEIAEIRHIERTISETPGSDANAVVRDQREAGLASDVDPSQGLTGHDQGRIAELGVLLNAGNDHPATPHEIAALADHLGLNDTTPATSGNGTLGEQRLRMVTEQMRADGHSPESIARLHQQLGVAPPSDPGGTPPAIDPTRRPHEGSVDTPAGLAVPIGPKSIDHDSRTWHLDGVGNDGHIVMRPTDSVEVLISSKDFSRDLNGTPEPGSTVEYNGQQYEVRHVSADGAVLQPVNSGERTRVPISEVGGFEGYIAGQDGVWTIREENGQLVATPADGGPAMPIQPGDVEPTFLTADIEARFEDDGQQHGIGPMDVHNSVLRTVREQNGLALQSDGSGPPENGVLDPRRGIGSAQDVRDVTIDSSSTILNQLADRLNAGEGPVDLHMRRLRNEHDSPKAKTNAEARAVIEALLQRADNGDPVTIYFGNDQHHGLDREMSPDLRDRLTNHENVRILMDPTEGTGDPYNHVKTTVIGGDDPTVTLATGPVDTLQKVESAITLGGEAATLYAEYVDLMTNEDMSPRRREVLEQLAARGVAVNDPLMGKYYAAESHVGLLSDSDVAVTMWVKELINPEVAQRIVERAESGVEMDITFRSVDPASEAILRQALERNPDLPLNLRRLDTKWHGNATFGLSSNGQMQGYVGTNYLWTNQSSNQVTSAGYENGVVLGGNDAWRTYDQMRERAGLSETPLIDGLDVTGSRRPEVPDTLPADVVDGVVTSDAPPTVDTQPADTKPDNRGAASQIPGSDLFNPGNVDRVWGDPEAGNDGALAREHAQDLDLAVNGLLEGNAAPAGVARDGSRLTIDSENGPTAADVQPASREVHADMIANGEVARYERQADGSYQITVVPGLDPLMAQRAVAHEIAEIRHIERAIAATGATTPDQISAVITSQRGEGIAAAVDPSGVIRPTAHDAGRIAELMTMHATDGADARVHREMELMAVHMGLGDATVHDGSSRTLGDLRLDAIETHLQQRVSAGEIDSATARAFMDRLRTTAVDAASNPNLPTQTTTDPSGRMDAGVELHSHFLGIPSVEQWQQWTGHSGTDLLRQIVGDGDGNHRIPEGNYDHMWPTSGEPMMAEAQRLLREAPGPDADPQTIAAHEARVQEVLETMMAAGQHVPFDAAYEIRDHLIKNDLDPNQGTEGYVEFSAMALYAMLNDGIHYTEQSNSVNKLLNGGPDGGGKFSPEVMAEARQRVLDRLVADLEANPGDPQTIRSLQLLAESQQGTRWLAMILTTHLAGIHEVTPETQAKLRELLQRPEVAGVDIASPEMNPFQESDDGTNPAFRILYDLVNSEANSQGRPLALRPHVGEGYGGGFDPTGEGRGGPLLDRDRPPVDSDGRPVHYDIAQGNLRNLVDTLDAISAENGGLDPNVLLRFGHATHADADIASRMASHGVYAEVNLTSNVETSAIVQPDRSTDATQIHPDTPLQGNEGHVPSADEHGLLTLIASGTKVVLSTDAQGVMHTTLANEYTFAQRIVDDFRSGRHDVPVLVDGAEVRVTYDQIIDAAEGRSDVLPTETAIALRDRFADPIGEMQRNALDYEKRAQGLAPLGEGPAQPSLGLNRPLNSQEQARIAELGGLLDGNGSSPEIATLAESLGLTDLTPTSGGEATRGEARLRVVAEQLLADGHGREAVEALYRDLGLAQAIPEADLFSPGLGEQNT